MDWASFSGQIFMRKFTNFLDENYKLEKCEKESVISNDFSSQCNFVDEDSTKSLQDTILSLKCEIESLRDLLGDKEVEIDDLKGKLSLKNCEMRPIKMEVIENEFVDNQESASNSQSNNVGEFLEQIGGDVDLESALGTVDYNLPLAYISTQKSPETKTISMNAIECVEWNDEPSCSTNDTSINRETYSVVKCPHCPFEHFDISSLVKHIRRVHKNAQPNCQLCNKSYFCFATLQRHVIEVHQKVRAHKCEICSKTFFRDFDLKRHVKTKHQGKRFMCTLCDKPFTTKYTLISHRQVAHGDVMNYNDALRLTADFNMT